MRTEICDGCEKTEPCESTDQLFCHVSILPDGWHFVLGEVLCGGCTKRVKRFVDGIRYDPEVA